MSAPVLVAAYQRVQALQRRVVRRGRLELLHGHVRRILVGAQRLGPHAVHEGLVVPQPVPRTEVDLDVALRGLVAVGQRKRVGLVAVRLLPEDRVHVLDRLDEKADHLLVVVGQVGEVGRESDGGVLIHECLHGRGGCGFGLVLRSAGGGAQQGGDGSGAAKGAETTGHEGDPPEISVETSVRKVRVRPCGRQLPRAGVGRYDSRSPRRIHSPGRTSLPSRGSSAVRIRMSSRAR